MRVTSCGRVLHVLGYNEHEGLHHRTIMLPGIDFQLHLHTLVDPHPVFELQSL
jgi:hypothetical protein